MMHPVSYLLYMILNLLWWLVLIDVILQWLVQFNILNRHQPFVAKVMSVLWQITEPIYRPIRRRLPHMNGLDLAPLIVILGISFLQYCLVYFN